MLPEFASLCLCMKPSTCMLCAGYAQAGIGSSAHTLTRSLIPAPISLSYLYLFSYLLVKEEQFIRKKYTLKR